MRTHTIACLMIASCFLISAAYGQVRINEVGYAGVDFGGAARWVELQNIGTADADVSGYWLCNFPDYSRLGNLTLLAGSTTIAPGAYLVVAFEAIGLNDGEVGLYRTNAFGSADAIVDYVQYGSAGHQRESVAAAAGIWEAGAFAEPVASGATLSFFEEENNASERWKAGTPTPEADNAAVTQTAVEPVPGEVPTRFLLSDNYPNPFNPSTTIPYEIDRGGHVTLSIYDLLGKKVIDLVDEEQTSGVYRATWDGRNNRGRVVATGVYVYRLTLGGEQSQTRVMTLIK